MLNYYNIQVCGNNQIFQRNSDHILQIKMIYYEYILYTKLVHLMPLQL